MQKLENLDTVHTHTGILIKINKLEQKINIELFSIVLFLHTKKVCRK